MDINGYQRLAMVTLNKSLNDKEMLTNAAMGLCGEAGEVIDLLKKNMFQGHDLDKDKIILELGDIAWYLAEAATALNIDLEEIFNRNISKLKKRYPEGFEVEKSVNRA